MSNSIQIIELLVHRLRPSNIVHEDLWRRSWQPKAPVSIWTSDFFATNWAFIVFKFAKALDADGVNARRSTKRSLFVKAILNSSKQILHERGSVEESCDASIFAYSLILFKSILLISYYKTVSNTLSIIYCLLTRKAKSRA